MIAEPRQRAPRTVGLEAAPSLVPFIKWPGGKSGELDAIAAAGPALAGRFIDPFVGGGSVLLAVPLDVPAWANDACPDLVALYRAAAEHPFGSIGPALRALAAAWDALGHWLPLYAEIADAFDARDDSAVSGILSTVVPERARELALAGPALPSLFVGRLGRDLQTKLRRMRHVEAQVRRPLSGADVLANVEGAVRAAFYTAVRGRYNAARVAARWDADRSADFLFLREFAYAAMFRFNAKDEFNVPYGGVSYNRKSLSAKVDRLFGRQMRRRLACTVWRSMDFEPFLVEASPTATDFVFVDPPYDSDFSAYDNRSFGHHDQARLAATLDTLDADVMVVIKDTPMIRALYPADRWHIREAPKTYMWTIKSRNDRDATHLTITNY